MVIGYQSNNYVGINNDYPDYELSVKATDSNESTIQILAGGNGKESNLLFGAPDDADVGAIKYDHNGDHMKFIVGGSERIKINSNGIQFGGSNGSDHALDDYEEGTWTLTQGNFTTFNLSSSQNVGRYVKVGGLVTCWFEQNGGSLAWSTPQWVGGLPFSVQQAGAGSFTNNYPNAGS